MLLRRKALSRDTLTMHTAWDIRSLNNDINCEYDISPTSAGGIVFSVWKLCEFIKTSPLLKTLSMSETHDYILDCMSQGMVQNFVVGERETGIFEITATQIECLLDSKNNDHT